MRRRDLIISEDPQMAAALEQFDRGDRSGVDKLLKQGVLNRRSSLDLMEQLDGDLNFGGINFGGMFQEAAVETAVAAEQAAQGVGCGAQGGACAGGLGGASGGGPEGDGHAAGAGAGEWRGRRRSMGGSGANSTGNSPRSRSSGPGSPGTDHMFAFDDFDHLDLGEFGLDGAQDGARRVFISCAAAFLLLLRLLRRAFLFYPVPSGVPTVIYLTCRFDLQGTGALPSSPMGAGSTGSRNRRAREDSITAFAALQGSPTSAALSLDESLAGHVRMAGSHARGAFYICVSHPTVFLPYSYPGWAAGNIAVHQLGEMARCPHAGRTRLSALRHFLKMLNIGS